MGLLPDTKSCALRMHRECRERFLRHRRKQLVNDPGMHHGTCVTHVPWCMSGSLTCCGGRNVPGIPGACAARSFTYLARGPCYVHVICRKVHFSNCYHFQSYFLYKLLSGYHRKKLQRIQRHWDKFIPRKCLNSKPFYLCCFDYIT